MFNVIERDSVTFSPRIVKSGFQASCEALAWIDAAQGVVDAEEDKENPGYTDVFTKHGRVLAIEPVK